MDAYVAAAKSEASTKARESGGGMSAVREAAAKAEEEARAKAEELGIGAVDLTEIDTEPMSAALDVLLAAQRAYFAEEASAQAAYAAQAAQSAPADDAADAADDTAEDDLTMEEETVDLSGFVATEAMNRLSAEVDDAYGALCGQIKAVFPALTDDVLATLKPTITGIVAVQNDRFELQYDRALAASGMNPGLNGVILREAYTMAVSAFGLLILAAAVLSMHYPVLLIFILMTFIAFCDVTSAYSQKLRYKSPILVAVFLSALVAHGGLQGWWIEPLLTGLGNRELFLGGMALSAFNDNAAITYLASLVPGFTESMKYMLVAGAVAAGGLTVIANAPNLAGLSVMKPRFKDGISPKFLLCGTALPTAITALIFYFGA